MDQRWSNRAASAEAAVTTRHLDRLWGLPGTQLGVVGWPSTATNTSPTRTPAASAGLPSNTSSTKPKPAASSKFSSRPTPP